MLRAGWVHASSYMLSVVSACIAYCYLLVRLWFCKEEYRNLPTHPFP